MAEYAGVGREYPASRMSGQEYHESGTGYHAQAHGLYWHAGAFHHVYERKASSTLPPSLHTMSRSSFFFFLTTWFSTSHPTTRGQMVSSLTWPMNTYVPASCNRRAGSFSELSVSCRIGMIGVLYVYYSTNIWATQLLMIDLPRRFIQKKSPAYRA